jgi:hypothetical protein
MRLLRLSAALTMLAVSASCARSSSVGGNEPSPDLTSTVIPKPSALVPSSLPPAMRPNVAEPDSRVIDLRPVRWNRVNPVAGRQIEVHYTIAGRAECAALGRVDVTETTREVTVTVLVGRLPNANCSGAQIQLAAPFMTMVMLAEPLGSRDVRDGAAS